MKKKIDTRPKVPFYIDEEKPKSDRAKIALFMRMRDAELDAEHAYVMNNQCPKCHVALTMSGECTNDCGYKQDGVVLKTRKNKAGNQLPKETNILSTAEQTNKIMELVGKGYSLQQAIDEVLNARRNQQIAGPKPTVWEYKGDMRCPECGKYGKLYTKGHRESTVLGIDCVRHGSFYKTPEKQFWRTKAQVEEEAAATKQA